MIHIEKHLNKKHVTHYLFIALINIYFLIMSLSTKAKDLADLNFGA